MHSAPDSSGDQGAGQPASPALSQRPGAICSRLPLTSLKPPNANQRSVCPQQACHLCPVPTPPATCPSHNDNLDRVIPLSPLSPPLRAPFPVPACGQLSHQLVNPCYLFIFLVFLFFFGFFLASSILKTPPGPPHTGKVLCLAAHRPRAPTSDRQPSGRRHPSPRRELASDCGHSCFWRPEPVGSHNACSARRAKCPP